MPALVGFLRYGPIGLGLALAILVYKLHSRVREEDKRNPKAMNPIFTFELFCLIMFLVGSYVSFLSSDALVENQRLRQELASNAEKADQRSREVSGQIKSIYDDVNRAGSFAGGAEGDTQNHGDCMASAGKARSILDSVRNRLAAMKAQNEPTR